MTHQPAESGERGRLIAIAVLLFASAAGAIGLTGACLYGVRYVLDAREAAALQAQVPRARLKVIGSHPEPIPLDQIEAEYKKYMDIYQAGIVAPDAPPAASPGCG